MATNEYRCSQCGICPAEKYPILYWRGKFYCRHCFQKEIHKIEQDVQKEKMNSLMDELRLQNDEEIPDDLMEFIIEKKRFSPIPKHRLTPKEIVAYLDQYVIGQDSAKKTLAVAAYSHFRRIGCSDSQALPKSNILMQGPTGSGKTFLLKNLAKLLNLPFAIVDASLITEASYKGKDLESVLTALYLAADKDIKKAEQGMVYLDEFDKLASSLGHQNNGPSVGEGVQRQMLKMIEGCVMDVPKEGAKMGTTSTVQINTENILFICGGAFVGIHKELEKKKRRIGYFSNLEPCESQEKKKLTPQDFMDYGLIPEIVGRLPVIVELDELTEEDLIDILLHSKSSFLKAYQNMLKKDGVELIFEKEAIEEIAHITCEKKTGARGLNAIIERIMENLMFEIPSDKSISKCIITRDVVLGKAEPIIEKNDLMSVE